MFNFVFSSLQCPPSANSQTNENCEKLKSSNGVAKCLLLRNAYDCRAVIYRTALAVWFPKLTCWRCCLYSQCWQQIKGSKTYFLVTSICPKLIFKIKKMLCVIKTVVQIWTKNNPFIETKVSGHNVEYGMSFCLITVKQNI